MIRWTYAYLDRPRARAHTACAFWSTVTGTRTSARFGERWEFATLVPQGADACSGVQTVEGDGCGVHLDLCTDEVPALVSRALALGAELTADHGIDTRAALRSPGGQPFCVVPWRGQRTRPSAHRDRSGATSRADQVCLDIPPSSYVLELGFWSALTGWDSRPTQLPEFHLLQPQSELPHRLLLQRLTHDDQPPAAHLDFACSDLEATRALHLHLGAKPVSEQWTWTVLRDPTGGVYCLTDRHPEGPHRPMHG